MLAVRVLTHNKNALAWKHPAVALVVCAAQRAVGFCRPGGGKLERHSKRFRSWVNRVAKIETQVHIIQMNDTNDECDDGLSFLFVSLFSAAW